MSGRSRELVPFAGVGDMMEKGKFRDCCDRRVEVEDHYMLKKPTTVLDGFVATFVGDSVITSHNQNFISQVPTGTAEVYVRTDSRYGPFHATILPRPHLEHYPILTKLFMELPIKVASQRHSTGYMYLQPKQHISSMPSSDDCVLPDKPSYKQHLMPTPAALLPSRQGLEHEAAAASLPNNSLQQQQLPPPPSPPPESALQMITTRMAEKKQVIACLFCRERQNRRGQSHHESEGRTCIKCARHYIYCEYPKQSRRGHKRSRRKKHNHDVNECSSLSSH